MSILKEKQKGNTCQYFSTLYLMQEENAGALATTDFNNFITYMVNKSSNNSSFISTYLSKPYLAGTTTYFNNIKDIILGNHYYIDNSKHAVVMTRTAADTFDVWNPQLCAVNIEKSIDNTLTTNKQNYPDTGKTTVDVWSLKSNLLNDATTTTERNRQIDIVNALSTYLTNNTTTLLRMTTIKTPGIQMNNDEKKALIMGLYAIDKGLSVASMKTALNVT